jgi:hypothetical protein
VGHDSVAPIIEAQGKNAGGGLLSDSDAVGFGVAVGD